MSFSVIWGKKTKFGKYWLSCWETCLRLEIFSHMISAFSKTFCMQVTVYWLKARLSLRILRITTSEIITEIPFRQISSKWIVIGNLIPKVRCQYPPDIEETLISYRNKSEVTLDSAKYLLTMAYVRKNNWVVELVEVLDWGNQECGFYNFMNKIQRRAFLCGFMP